jgi:serine/threonine protein kinase
LDSKRLIKALASSVNFSLKVGSSDNIRFLVIWSSSSYEGKASYLQTFCGTICYSAPEMLKGEKYAGEKVDVCQSLGIVRELFVEGRLV